MLHDELPIDEDQNLIEYTKSDLEFAFDFLAKKVPVTFDYPQGGCQQRSHLLSLILLKKFKIEHRKIWLFAPSALFENDNRSLFIEDKNQISYNNLVYWNFHTAPAIKIKNTQNSFDWYIIDPSLEAQRPLLIHEWLLKIGNSELSKYTFLRPEKYFFNCKYNDFSQLTNVFDGTFFEYVNPAKDNLMMEKGLAMNDMAMQIYDSFIKPLMTKNDNIDLQQLTDLKDVFGNATALDMIFAQNISGFTENTSYRYVLNNYGKIIKEAKNIFHQRLLFWTNYCDKYV